MSTVNNVVIVGRAGKDPEMRYFESGKCKTTFSVATNRPTKEKETDWHDIELWGKQAEIAGEYVRKGNSVGVTGSVEKHSWESEGNKHTKTIIKGQQLILLGSKKDNEQQQQPPKPKQPEQADIDSLFANEDEIPF